MNKAIYGICAALLLILAPSIAHASSGSGLFSLGYIYQDQEGNASVNQPAFNIYEGPSISIENLRYLWDNGLVLRSDMRNIILNNRNLNLSFAKPGLFGISLHHDQYRRIYNFDGTSFVRRHTNHGSLWIYPHQNLKLWGKGGFIGRSGTMANIFDVDPGSFTTEVDYEQLEYEGGFLYKYLGRMLRGEFRGVNYTDNTNPDRDQTRAVARFDGLLPLPYYEWIILSGGFRRFVSKLEESEFEISSNRVWGGVTAYLPKHFELRYHVVFDRASSDSDFVATDNIINAIYAGHTWPGLARVMVGYQHSINDDFEDEIKGNGYYASGWLKPADGLQLSAEYGRNDEEVKQGSRLIGDEERSRYRAGLKYNADKYGKIQLKFESKIRENEQLGTEVDYKSLGASYSVEISRYGFLTGGYTYSKGDYTNISEDFEFTDHTVYGDITTLEYYRTTAGFGISWYRSQRDLDVESFILRFSAIYNIYPGYKIEGRYNVHNFDDFMVRDKYYTSNVVEIKIIKDISF